MGAEWREGEMEKARDKEGGRNRGRKGRREDNYKDWEIKHTRKGG